MYRVGVERNALFAAHRADFRNRLQRAYFVIGKHNGDERGIGSQSLRHLRRRHDARRAHVEISHFEPLAFQLFKRVQNRVVLERRGHDMLFAALRARLRRGAYRLIIRLASARGKIHLARLAPKPRRNARARLLQRLFRALSLAVQRRRIAVHAAHIRHCRLYCALAHGGCRRIVYVYNSFICHKP